MRQRIFTLLGCAMLLVGRSARADVSSWLSVGGGVGLERNAGKVEGQTEASPSTELAPVFTAAIGVGSDPTKSFALGGLLRSTTYIGIGTELAIGPRLATGGFLHGDLGFAFDFGVAGRFYDQSNYGRVPLQAGVVVGLPWGMQLETGARFLDLSGQNSALGGFVTFGVDLLRFSVHRRGRTEQSWPNPAPAGVLPALTSIPGEDDAEPVLRTSPKRPVDSEDEPSDGAPPPTLR